MAKTNKRMMTKALHSPFSAKKLRKFLKTLPKKARIKIVTVSFVGFDAAPAKSYIQAEWKEKVTNK